MSEEWKITPPPVPMAAEETLAWAREHGRCAGDAGLPPSVPVPFAAYAKAWMEGWRAGSDEQRMPGWKSLNVDYDWKGR